MADKKVFSIQIDGIKQSVDGVESLGSAVKGTTKTFDDYIKVVNKLQQYQEAYAKIEESEFRKQIKNQYELKKARETVAAGMGKTYAEQQKYLTALGKVIKNTEGDVSGLIKEYNALNDKLNQVDATMGNHQRNVGNYTSALGNFNKPFSGVVNVAKSAVSAFQLYNGVMTAFGASTEESTKAMEKLMSTMSIIQSLNELNNTFKQGSVMGNLFTKAMNAMALGIKGTTTVTKLLRGALMGIGIGLIIGLVAALVEHWDDLKKVFTDTFPILKTLSDRFNGLKGVIFGVGNAIKVALMTPFEKLGKAFMKLIKGDFKGAIKELTGGWGDAWDKIKKGFHDGVAYSRQTTEKGAEETKKTITKTAKETADKVKELNEKMLADLVKAEKKAQEEIQRLREEDLKKEKERLERLAKLRDKDKDAEYKYQKAKLELDLQEATSDEEKLEIKQKLLDLETKIAKEKAMQEAAETMGISVEELQQRLDMTEGKWTGLNEEQIQVLQTLQTQIATIELGAEKAKKALSGATSSNSSSSGSGSTDKKDKNPYTKKWHELIYGGDGTQDEMSEKAQQLAEAVGTAYQETIGPVFDGVMNLGDAIHQAMEFAIEEAENALEEAEEMHDEAVEKVSESKDRISDINERMKESSGAQLEAYKTQMADEMLLLQQREQEERRLEKEKEKREKELEKQKKKQRKLELQQQLIQAIVSGALAVVNGLATQPFMPVGIAMGALAGVATAIQIATITKQLSKLADGGVLGGRYHSDGGNPVPAMGVEVERGEAVINRKSTAKFLPLLDAINAEGNGGKHTLLKTANNIDKYAEGGVLNYQRIDEDLNYMNSAKSIERGLASINFSPQVAVVDIARGINGLTQVRELAGATSPIS